MFPVCSTLGALRVDDLLPSEERRPVRRSAPERLRFEPPGPAPWDRLDLAPPRRGRPGALRVRLGDALVALGHRLAGDSVAS